MRKTVWMIMQKAFLFYGVHSIIAMKKIIISLSDEMVKVIEKVKKAKMPQTIPKTICVTISEYLRK